MEANPLSKHDYSVHVYSYCRCLHKGAAEERDSRWIGQITHDGPKSRCQKGLFQVCWLDLTFDASASPYKSRMDIKDACTNEPAFPLIYYTVNDFERRDLHMRIRYHRRHISFPHFCVLLDPSSSSSSSRDTLNRENEYLCVELSCIYPRYSPTGGADADPQEQDIVQSISEISIDEDSNPFPDPPAGYSKTVMFQGAVPYVCS